MFYLRPPNLGASYLLKFCDITIKLIRKSTCLYFLFLLFTYVPVHFSYYVARKQSRKMKIEIHSTWGIRLAGACVAPGMCAEALMTCLEVWNLLTSPPFSLFSSLSVLHLSVFTITSLSCNHIDKLKLSSRSCFSIVSCGKGCGFHGLQSNGAFSGSATVGCSSAKARGKKWQKRQEVVVCVCLDLCLSAVSVF